MRLDVRVHSAIGLTARGGRRARPPLVLASAAVVVAVVAAALTLILAPETAHGANFTVNSMVDEADANPGDGACDSLRTPGTCTLRAAIQEANALAGDDTITVPTGTFTLTISGAPENTAVSGDLDIAGSDKLTIIGAGAANTIINGGGIDRVFQVLGFATLEISGVIITNGNPGAFEEGGGIFNGGTLTMSDSQVINNTADPGGGIYNRASGGLLIFAGTATLTNVSVSGNSRFGVFNGGTLTWTDVTANANTGGGIANQGTLTMTNGEVSGNAPTTNAQGFGGGSPTALVARRRSPTSASTTTPSSQRAAASTTPAP